MGLFDLFGLGEIVPELKELGNEIQGIKDEFIASVLEPSAEFKEAINGIASDISGEGAAPSDNVTTSNSTSIPISDGNENS